MPTTHVRTLTPDDLPALIRIRQASFGTPRDPVSDQIKGILARRTPYMRGLDVDGQLAAACTWYPKPAWIGGVHLPTAGLAAVISAPESRRRGHVRTLIADGLRELHERRVGWAGEHPFDPRFYDRMGFRCVPSSVVLQLPFDRLPGGPAGVAFAPVSIDDPEVRNVRRAFAQGRSFTLDRDDPPDFEVDDSGVDTRWADLLEAPNDRSTPGTLYGTDDGYAIVAVEGHGRDAILHVVDAAWSSPAGRGNVLAMLGAWNGQAGTVRIELPVDDPIARRDVAEWSRPRTPLQVRVADLVSALQPLRAPGGRDGAVVLRVHDDLAPWNEGTWRIETGDGGCTVDPSTAAADATLEVGALTALLAGTPAAALVASGEAQGSVERLNVLADLTRDHPPFLGLADYY